MTRGDTPVFGGIGLTGATTCLYKGEGLIYPKTAVGGIREEGLCPVPLLFSGYGSGRSRYLRNPEGESVGWSEPGLERQKEGNRSESRMTPTAEARVTTGRTQGDRYGTGQEVSLLQGL